MPKEELRWILNERNGISLIVLVITIIVMIILSGATILVLSGAGIIGKTNKAVLHTDLRTMQEELEMYVSNKALKSRNRYKREELYANKDMLVENGKTVEGKTIRDVLQSVSQEYLDEIEVVSGEITYTGKSIDKAKIANEVLLGVRNHDLVEKNTYQDEIKLEDSTKLNLVNYRIYGNGEAELPEEYQAIEYIQSTGTQYIDTDVIPNNNLTIKCKTSFGYGTLFGAEGEVASNTIAIAAGTDNKEYIRYFQTSGTPIATELTSNSIYELEFTPTKTIFKDTDGNLETLSYTASGSSPQCSLYLFARNLTGSVLETSYSSRRIYYLKIYNDKVLVRDYIPCYRKSDGETGMYDIVNNVFYTNKGTGEFLKGEDIGSVGDYVVDMNFDNKWIQGHVWGYESLKTNRLTSKNLIKSESGVKYEITSNLPENIQFAVTNGRYTTYPYNSNDCVYDSSWQDDSLIFTSTVDGNISISIRYKDDSNITPEDLSKYEINIKKYPDEKEDGGKYIIPIKVTGKNFATAYDVCKKLADYTETTLDGRECVRYQSNHSIGSAYTDYSFKENTQYTVSFDIKSVAWHTLTGFNCTLGFWYTDGTFGSGNYSPPDANHVYNSGDTVSEWKRVVLTSRAGKTVKGISTDGNHYTMKHYIDVNTFQIEEGVVSTEYEPYREEIQNIYLDEPLRKYGDYVDYIDFRTQEVVRYVEVVDSSGEEVLRGLETPIREKVKLPSVMLNEKTNIFSVLTKYAPSKIETIYYTK